MWRWVTRGLVLTFVAALFAPTLLAQGFVADLELPGADPSIQHSGMILVRGWALAPQQITKIELYVDGQFQHNVNRSLPRIDIVEAFPNYPGIHTAAPGFQTGFRADRFPNGPHSVEVRIYTSDGEVHFLGPRTININNTINQAPFGSIDIPHLGGIHNASGSFPVNGWAADTDGVQRVEVLIDGTVMQGAMYGDPRPDVGNAFPDFTNAQYAGFVAHVDTTRVINGVHLLTVNVVDRRGMSRTIGTRQIQVINNDLFLKPFGYVETPQRDAVLFGTGCGQAGGIISPAPVRPQEHITLVRGWALDLSTRTDVGRVAYAELLIDGVPWVSTDSCGVIGGRYANCYGVPRFDVARFFPTYPDAPRAGFIFTLDVGLAITAGIREGNHRLSVRVGDRDQTFAELPNRDGIPVFFQCATSTFDSPGFGFIDFPNMFDFVGGDVTFTGWAVDVNGVTAVELILDGNFIGTAQYGFNRSDVADANPTILNAANSGWRFTMDTRRLTNARHRLTARVLDNQGRRTEIGSVDFYTQNNPTP